MLWALPASHMLDDGLVGSRTDGDRLLDQAVEELPSVLRGASIEAKGEFVQVRVEVLTTDGPLVCSQQPALQKGRDTMNPRKKSRGLLGAALHNASRVAIAVIGKRSIGLQPITHYRTALLDRLPDEGGQAVARPIGDPLHANASNPFAANLGGNDHQRLVPDVPTPSARFNPADERLVAADSQHAVQADGTRPVLLPNDPPHRLKPESERLPSVLKDGAGGDGHCGFACATPKELVRREPCFGAPAVRASKALGPPQLHQIIPTGLLRGELAVEFGCRSRVLHGPPTTTPGGNSSQGNTPLASTFLVSPFKDATVVSVDGFGDFASAAWGVGHGSRIEVKDKVYFPHSLGIFYMALTQYLGFPAWGDEYKVMGLALYGEPQFINEMRQIVRLEDNGSFRLELEFFRHHKETIEDQWENGEPRVAALYAPALEALLGPARQKGDELTQRHRDLARSIQAMYEEAFFHLLSCLHNRHGMDTLVLAGGCAMNSVANGKVRRMTRFKQVYIQSAAGDAGGAIGAAFAVANQLGQTAERFHMSHAYWGPAFSHDYHERLLEEKAQELKAQGCHVEQMQDEAELCRRTTQAIADGRVIGWFQGRMEWGPRALGNRSILCDPRRADMKDILNLKIKRRESFRPFAPSVLREAVSQWFEEEDDVPFMMQVFQIREEKRRIIPAVTHVDGSGRLQTVYRDTNPRYYHLIEAFADLTGIPIVLNTSFNENEPIVCRPEEALDCFLRTKMDVLVLGNWFIARSVA